MYLYFPIFKLVHHSIFILKFKSIFESAEIWKKCGLRVESFVNFRYISLWAGLDDDENFFLNYFIFSLINLHMIRP